MSVFRSISKERLDVVPTMCPSLCTFFPSDDQGRAQGMPKLLSGQDQLDANVAVVEWILDTVRPLTVCQNTKFRKMKYRTDSRCL